MKPERIASLFVPEALKLEETRFFFKNPLPAETMDECRVATSNKRPKCRDALQLEESTKALCLAEAPSPSRPELKRIQILWKRYSRDTTES
jgi:hypothetical protein